MCALGPIVLVRAGAAESEMTVLPATLSRLSSQHFRINEKDVVRVVKENVFLRAVQAEEGRIAR